MEKTETTEATRTDAKVFIHLFKKPDRERQEKEKDAKNYEDEKALFQYGHKLKSIIYFDELILCIIRLYYNPIRMYLVLSTETQGWGLFQLIAMSARASSTTVVATVTIEQGRHLDT